MKKLVAFVMILGLGLFCAVGCSKPQETDAAEDAADGKHDGEEGEARRQ